MKIDLSEAQISALLAAAGLVEAGGECEAKETLLWTGKEYKSYEIAMYKLRQALQVGEKDG